jgi:large subunit ribosomal protein L18
MKNSKKIARIRRSRLFRAKNRRLNVPRLCVHKTPRHMYAQIIVADISDKIIVSASTLIEAVGKKVKYTGNVDAAGVLGEEIARLAIAAGIKRVAFDRSGHKYHGRIKALAEKAREAGLEF